MDGLVEEERDGGGRSVGTYTRGRNVRGCGHTHATLILQFWGILALASSPETLLEGSRQAPKSES